MAKARNRQTNVNGKGKHTQHPATGELDNGEGPPAADAPPAVADCAPGPEFTTEPAESVAPALRTVPVRVPLGTFDETAYTSAHIDIRLNGEQARVAKQLTVALNDQHAQLADGKHVDSTASALRWLLEQIAMGDKKAIKQLGN